MRLLPILALAVTLLPSPHLHAQASALPNANPDAEQNTPDRGRKLLDQMVQALGGEKWLNRTTWLEEGQTGHFYKSTPDPYVVGFQEYHRAQPFAIREVFVEHVANLAALGLPGRNHHDVANVWNDQGGWEITYKGKKELPKEDVAEFERVRKHSLDVIVQQWLKQPGVIITFDGTEMAGRRLAQKVNIINEANDSAEIALEESTHLPITVTFKLRNDTYKDFDTETVEYSDYHEIQGIQTPMTVTRSKNGDTVSQRFLKKVDYNIQVAPDLFDPDRPLHENVKK
jgi:hypothetical protein